MGFFLAVSGLSQRRLIDQALDFETSLHQMLEAHRSAQHHLIRNHAGIVGRER